MRWNQNYFSFVLYYKFRECNLRYMVFSLCNSHFYQFFFLAFANTTYLIYLLFFYDISREFKDHTTWHVRNGKACTWTSCSMKLKKGERESYDNYLNFDKQALCIYRISVFNSIHFTNHLQKHHPVRSIES